MPTYPVCGQQVDAMAPACPSCGAKRAGGETPTAERPERWGWTLGRYFGVVICFAAVVTYFIISSGGSDSASIGCLIDTPLFLIGVGVYVVARWMERR